MILILIIVKITRLEKFVNSLDLKGESLVGQNGIKISGGQKQRIGIAEKFTKNQNFLYLMKAPVHLTKLLKKIFLNIFEIMQRKNCYLCFA